MTYKRISRYWHKLTTEHGVFFGYSREEVETKARAAELQASLKAARRHAQAQRFRDIAAQEQAEFLRRSDTQRGIR